MFKPQLEQKLEQSAGLSYMEPSDMLFIQHSDFINTYLGDPLALLSTHDERHLDAGPRGGGGADRGA